MAKPVDLFDPANLQLPEHIVSRLEESQKSALRDGELHRQPRGKTFHFYQFPSEVLEAVALSAKNPTLIVLCVLYRLYFKNYFHNPVIITSQTLKKFGLSKYQKLRALKLLEKTGCIAVKWNLGKNPRITLKWRPH